MLRSLEIENFRCFKHHTVPFRENTIIVGQNNAGKSTLIEALRLVGLAQNRYRHVNYTGPPEWMEGIPEAGAGFRPSIERFDLSPEGLFHQNGEPPARISAKFRNGAHLSVFVGPKFDQFAVAYKSKSSRIYSRAEANKAHIPDMAVLPPLSLPLNNEKVLTERTTKIARGSDLASSHFRNEILRFKDEHFSDFKSLAERTWPGLQIREFKEGGSIEEPALALMVRDGPFVEELAWMGSGLKMWLQIMWFLATSKSAKIIVLDEPDIYMHPDLQRKLIRITGLLKGQTILTTHSVELISEVEPEDVLVLDERRSESRFAAGLASVQDALNMMGSGQSVQLMRLSTARRFLIIEGKDVPLLSRFQAVLFPDTAFPLGSIPSQSIGGWDGWSRAVGASTTLKNAAGERITVYCLFDRDYHSDSSIESRRKAAKEEGIEIHVWKRKEIENYFLLSGAITRAINAGIEDHGTPVTESDVKAALSDIAEELKEGTFDALAEYMQLADKARGVANANRLARARVEASWSTLEDRLGVVSGKAVLSRISKWSQDSKGVSLNPGAISRCMQPGDVALEVSHVLGSIEHGKGFDELDSK